MNLGKLRDYDIGRWFVTDDGQVAQLLKVWGALTLIQIGKSRVYWPIHDIERRASDEEVARATGSRRIRIETKPKETKVYRLCRHVVRTDRDGNEETFRSLKEAASGSGLSPSTVSNICTGKRQEYKGFRFRYEEIPTV